jgi:hypothetical protein
MTNLKTYSDFVESIPSARELREQLARNQRERDLIKRLIQLSEQKERLRLNRDGQEVVPCQQ